MSDKERKEIYSKKALEYSDFYNGKVEIMPKVPIRSLDDFSVWYSPGVAEVSSKIAEDEELSFKYTGRWNTIAIVTDGSRVLGLGNIGPAASLPVMEGKSLIYKYLGGVDAIPIPINAHKPEDIIETVRRIQPGFGGINLEDIESPKCFHVLDECKKTMDIPVWHDDQQGTAGVTLAGLINALKITNRKIQSTNIVLYGCGAANIAFTRLVIKAGADPGRITLIDSKGILEPEREDIDELMLKNHHKYELAIITNKKRLKGDPENAFMGADVLIAASRQGPNIIPKKWISKMNSDSIVFSEANPIPEIWPQDALAAGARIAATGRSDFPNQVNNSLLFPAMFRGVLDVRSTAITDEMVITAAVSIAKFAEDKGINETYIIPNMTETDFYPEVASEVAFKAIKTGYAKLKISKEEVYQHAYSIIQKSQNKVKLMYEKGIIPKPPKII